MAAFKGGSENNFIALHSCTQIETGPMGRECNRGRGLQFQFVWTYYVRQFLFCAKSIEDNIFVRDIK